MPTRNLPDRPNLSQYKKQAKALVKACAAGDADALQRVRELHPRAPAKVTLADAQFVMRANTVTRAGRSLRRVSKRLRRHRRLPQYGDRRSAPLSQETWQRSSA